MFWVIPEENYIVQIWIDDANAYEEYIAAEDIQGGVVYSLNNGEAIEE